LSMSEFSHKPDVTLSRSEGDHRRLPETAAWTLASLLSRR
jgi:hypothetical protein